MKQGLGLYASAVGQLFSNIWPALRATAPAWVALTIVTSLAAFLIVGEVATPENGGAVDQGFVLPPYFWTYFMVAQCLGFMTLGYIGPKFHRSLLPENTSDLPFPYSAYLFGMMQIGLIGIGLGFLASRLVSVISRTLPGPLGDLTVPLLFLLAILYVLLRFVVILPSIAMGRPKTLHQAWVMTQPFKYAFLTSLILLVLTIAGLHSLALFSSGEPWLSLVLGTIASWFALMVLLSYLNVIYRETRRNEVRMARKL